MSIQSEINRISGNVSDALDAIEAKGVTVPAGSNSDDLADLIEQISGGGGVVITDTLDSHGGTIREIMAVDTFRMEERSVTPSTSAQVVEPSSGYNAISKVTVAAMPSGSAGTPTASKGTVSNHQVSVTPSVTNTTGYITGSTKTGTAVTVTASELASGNKEITSNGSNIDVVGYSTVSVNVSGGSSKNVQYVMGSKSVRTNGYTSTGMSITVAKAGTYNVSWVGWRSSSQGTMGTNLYKNGSAGTNQQTFTNTYGQCITLENQSYAQGDVLTLYATAGSTTRYMLVANLIIEEQ